MVHFIKSIWGVGWNTDKISSGRACNTSFLAYAAKWLGYLKHKCILISQTGRHRAVREAYRDFVQIIKIYDLHEGMP